MKIHSDIIHYHDIWDALPAGCDLVEVERNGRYACIHVEGSRSRARGFHVRMSGSSPYNMQRLPEKSATWDEWGIFIDRLFRLDPDAIIGVYKGRDDFIAITRAEHERISQWRPDLVKWHSAPWLREFCPVCNQPDNCGDCTHER